MIHAILPAAGLSSRMGRPKLLLPFGKRTILATVIAVLKEAGIESVVTVVSPDQPEIADEAQNAGSQVVRLSVQTPEMRATILAGFDWIEQQYRPQPSDRWLLIPADHPSLDAGVIRQLVQVRDAQTAYSIVVPAYQGQRGHPVLVDWRHVDGIRQLSPGQGINRYFREQAGQTLEVPVDYPSVLFDLDTPEDYARLLQSL